MQYDVSTANRVLTSARDRGYLAQRGKAVKPFRSMPVRLARKKVRSWEHTVWLLGLTPGDVVNTCDLFNHVVVKVTVEWGRPAGMKRGWVPWDVDIRYTDHVLGKDVGACSGFHCGVTPALSQEEWWWLAKPYDDAFEDAPQGGHLHLRRLLNLVERGEEIFDGQRLLKPEFSRP
jgi:hypothetical protein